MLVCRVQWALLSAGRHTLWAARPCSFSDWQGVSRPVRFGAVQHSTLIEIPLASSGAKTTVEVVAMGWPVFIATAYSIGSALDATHPILWRAGRSELGAHS